MRRLYFNSILVCLLSLCGLGGWAQTFYAGLNGTSAEWKEGNGWAFCMVGLDVSDPSTVTEVPFKGTSESAFEIAGCLAGKVYYAVMYDENEETYTLHSLNCTTGTDVNIASTESVLDMTYDSKFDIVYAIKRYSTDTEDGTALCEVNTKTGALTQIMTFNGKNFWGVAAKNGVVYLGENASISGDWWNYNLQFTTYDAGNMTLGEVTGLGKVKGVGSTNCMEFDGDKLYMIQGRRFYTVDLSAKTVSLSDQELPRELAGICFAKSSEDGQGEGGGTVDPQPVSKGLVSLVETYGDPMGDFQGLSSKEYTFYDKNKRPVRRAKYEANGDNFDLARYFVYEYDEAGHLVCSYNQQYGAGRSGDEDGFGAPHDSIEYTYDDQGRLEQETNKGKYEVYRYHYENGELVGKLVYLMSNLDEPIQTIYYDDYVAPGCPQTVHAEGAYTYLNYTETFKYNEAGQKTERHRKAYNERYTDENATEPVIEEVPVESEYWTYDAAGTLVCDSLLKCGYDDMGLYDGKIVPSSKVVYSADNGSDNRTVAKTYTANYDEDTQDYTWAEAPVYTITQTTEFEPLLATELSVAPVEGKLNTQKLSFTVPEEAMLGSYTFDVYRHGFKIARVNLSDEGAYDFDTNMLNYVDADVPNGTYDYYVQTVYNNDETGEEVGQTTSNVVRQTVYTELPAPTNVHGVEAGVDGIDSKVRIAWDAPEGYEDYGFKRYNVIFQGYRTADNFEADGQATEWVTDMEFQPKELYVQAVYKYGKANSDVVTIDYKDLPTGVESLQADGQQASYADGVLTLTQPAAVTVYTAGGVKVLSATNANSVSLQQLPQGTYVVAVSTSGKCQVVKLVR